MIFEPFDTWQTLGVIGLRDRGEYDPDVSEPYRYFDFVYYEGSSWLAVVDNPVDPPSDVNSDWKPLAKGFSDAELQVLGVKGDAEIEYRNGYINLTKDDLGLERVENYSLEDIQKNTVASFSWNGQEQKLTGDIDIPIVNGIIYNGKDVRHGTVRINSIEGISINGQPVQRGLIITDIVTGLKVNGRKRQIGEADIRVVEGIVYNGKRLFQPVPVIEAIEGIKVNNGEIQKGIVNLESVTSLSVNGKRSKRGDLELSIVESLSINGNRPKNGNISLDVVNGISVNGAKAKRGIVNLDVVTELLVNGKKRKPERGIIDLKTVEEISVNGKSPLVGKVKLELVEGIKVNGVPVPLKKGVADLNVVTDVYFDNEYIENKNGTISINSPNKEEYTVCPSLGDETDKHINLKSNYKLEKGSIVHVQFLCTNTVYPLTLTINNKESYPLLMKGKEVTERNAINLKENGIYSFIFDGDNWNYLNGTNNLIEYIDYILDPEQFYEKDGMFYYEMEIEGAKKEDMINISYPMGLGPETVLGFDNAGIYVYAQDDGKITLAAHLIPECELPVLVTIQ